MPGKTFRLKKREKKLETVIRDREEKAKGTIVCSWLHNIARSHQTLSCQKRNEIKKLKSKICDLILLMGLGLGLGWDKMMINVK